MAEEHHAVKDAGSKEANEKMPKKGGKLEKYKWYIIGGLAVIAVLVFYFTRSNSSSSSTNAAAGQTAASGIDPSTGVPYASEYGAGGAYAIPGPAGATGATGARGKTGKTGKQGKRGARGPRGTTPKPKKPKKPARHGGPVHRHTAGTMARVPTIHATPNVHPAAKLAAAHGANRNRAA